MDVRGFARVRRAQYGQAVVGGQGHQVHDALAAGPARETFLQVGLGERALAREGAVDEGEQVVAGDALLRQSAGGVRGAAGEGVDPGEVVGVHEVEGAARAPRPDDLAGLYGGLDVGPGEGGGAGAEGELGGGHVLGLDGRQMADDLARRQSGRAVQQLGFDASHGLSEKEAVAQAGGEGGSGADDPADGVAVPPGFGGRHVGAGFGGVPDEVRNFGQRPKMR